MSQLKIEHQKNTKTFRKKDCLISLQFSIVNDNKKKTERKLTTRRKKTIETSKKDINKYTNGIKI